MSEHKSTNGGALTLKIPAALWPLIFALVGGAAGGSGSTYLAGQSGPQTDVERRLHSVEQTVQSVRDNQLLICLSLDVECER